LALIPITIVLGLVAANMGSIMYDTQDLVYRTSVERAAQDTANALLKTSGDPYNWETLSSSQIKSVGLAKYNPDNKVPIEYVLSTEKIAFATPSRVQNLLGSLYSFQLVITTFPTLTNGSYIIRDITSEGNTNTKESASDVVAVERVVRVSGFDILLELKNIRGTGKPITKNGNFPTSEAYLDAFDYYVYVDNADQVTSGRVEINDVSGNNRVIGPNDWSTSPLVVKIDPETQKLKNQELPQMNNVEARLTGKPGSIMDVYIIRVPKGTPKESVNPYTIHGEKAKFVLYVWTR